MENLIFDEIERTASYLKLSINAQEIADVILKNRYTEGEAKAISDFLLYLKEKRHDNLVNMLQQMSRIPLKNPKTFDNYDFSRINGKNVEALKELSTLSSLYAHKNLAFIGPQGVGKTHLAMAYGRVCCSNEYKAYFLKATELNQKFTDARRLGRESAVINNLVNPACLIIDEIGRCVIPLIQREVCDNKKWLNEDEILEVVAIAESTPGPVAINAATFVGSRTAGTLGAVCATLGVVLPSFLIISLISFILKAFQESRAVQYAFMGIRAGVLALILKAVYTMFMATKKHAVSYVIMAAALVLTAFLKIDAVFVIIGCAVFGLVWSLLFRKEQSDDMD